jgi:mono/diheme cytochrome c family protein
MKRGRIVLLVVIVLIVAGALVVRQILHDGLSAKAAPTRMETAIARRVRHLAIPADARALANPTAASAETVSAGMMHFADHCATCHGNDGSGDTMYGHGLYPKPPDLRLAATQELSDGELFWIIENGVRFTGMPGFSSPAGPEASWHLVRFIRHLPQLSPAERLEMESNNPKTPDELDEEKDEKRFLKGENPAAKDRAKPHHHH